MLYRAKINASNTYLNATIDHLCADLRLKCHTSATRSAQRIATGRQHASSRERLSARQCAARIARQLPARRDGCVDGTGSTMAGGGQVIAGIGKLGRANK